MTSSPSKPWTEDVKSGPPPTIVPAHDNQDPHGHHHHHHHHHHDRYPRDMKFYPEDIVLILLALFFPPGAALLIKGCGIDLVLNIILCFLGGFPGMLHAFWLVYLKKRDEQWWWQRRNVPKGLST